MCFLQVNLGNHPCTCLPPPLSHRLPFSPILHHLCFEDNDLSGSLLISFSPFLSAPSIRILFLLSSCNEPGSPHTSLPQVRMGAEIHLPSKKNDIIFLLHSQSDASTWSTAFMEALCTQDRQTEMGNYRETDVQNHRCLFYFI